MSVDTLLCELAETPGVGIFIPGFARNLGGTLTEKKKKKELAPTKSSFPSRSNVFTRLAFLEGS